MLVGVRGVAVANAKVGVANDGVSEFTGASGRGAVAVDGEVTNSATDSVPSSRSVTRKTRMDNVITPEMMMHILNTAQPTGSQKDHFLFILEGLDCWLLILVTTLLPF